MERGSQKFLGLFQLVLEHQNLYAEVGKRGKYLVGHFSGKHGVYPCILQDVLHHVCLDIVGECSEDNCFHDDNFVGLWG